MKGKRRSFLERAAAAIAAFRGQVPGRRAFNAADGGRLFADWVTSRLTRDDETRWSLAQMRARARDLENNDPTTRHYLRLLTTNVLGADGIRLQSQVRNNDGRLNRLFNDRIEEAWADWCWQPTRDGKMDFVSLQRLLLRTVARDGEAFVRVWRGFSRNRFGFALEPFDPDLIDETFNRAKSEGVNEVRLGVEVDSDGRPVAYHAFTSVGTLSGVPRQRVRLEADTVLHLYDPERVGQTRGVSWMTPVMVSLKMLAGYVEAELVASRIGASKMGFFQKKSDAMGAGGLPATDGAFTMEANPGTFGVLPEGYELSTWAPEHPAGAFGDFVKAALRSVSTGLGVTYNALANDLEGVNYSSIRAGLLIERDLWRCLQRWWVAVFLRPVFIEWLNMALLNGAVVLDSRDHRKFLRFKFVPRGWAWVDPLKDTNAGIAGIGAGLTSRTTLLAEQGMDVEDVFESLAEEARLAKDYGIELEGTAVIPEVEDESEDEAEDAAEGEVEDAGEGAGGADLEDEGAEDDGAELNGAGRQALIEALRSRIRGPRQGSEG